MSDMPQTKAELMAQLATGWQRLDERLQSLSNAQLTACAAPGEWSIKDHIAHLMVYERGMVALLRHEPRWAAMQLSVKFVRDSESFDEINAVLYEHYHAPVAFLYEATVLAICIVVFMVAVPETLKKAGKSNVVPESRATEKTV